MNETIILGKENNKVTYKVVKGYKLQNGFFAHREHREWVLSDYDSGLMVQDHLKSFSAVKALANDFNLRTKVEEMKKSERYNKLMKLRSKFYKEYFFNKN